MMGRAEDKLARQRRNRLRPARCLAPWLAVLAVGAAKPDPPASPTPEQRPLAALRERAELLWRARRSDDWATLYSMQSPDYRATTSSDAFLQGQSTHAILEYLDSRILAVEIDDSLGWVHAASMVRHRKFPRIPPRKIERWETWRLIDSKWFICTAQEAPEYPAAPSLRDPAAERQLRPLIDAYMEDRRTGRIEALYARLNPRTRERLSLDNFSEKSRALVTLSVDAVWIEVIGHRARVKLLYVVRSADPHLSKAPSRKLAVIESWSREAGNWYRDEP